MKTRLQTQLFRGRAEVAFTMIEIALCIAIVGFAMVAIMGVLPTGMSVQKDNREETVVSQDGQYFIDVIRNGVTTLSEITNNLVWVEFRTNGVPIIDTTYSTGSLFFQSNNNFSARQIIGFLGTPKVDPVSSNTLYMRARFLANSGAQAVKGTNTRDLAFSYLMTTEIVPFANFYNTADRYATNLVAGLYEARVTLRWPVYGETNVGLSRQVFRALINGHLRKETSGSGNDLYFFEPSIYQPVYP